MFISWLKEQFQKHGFEAIVAVVVIAALGMGIKMYADLCVTQNDIVHIYDEIDSLETGISVNYKEFRDANEEYSKLSEKFQSFNDSLERIEDDLGKIRDDLYKPQVRE